MRKLVIASAIALAASILSLSAFSADTATLAITGTITPATCEVSLSNTSLSAGNIAASSLTNDVNQFEPGNSTLSVACDAASAVAIQTTDNRSASAMTKAEVSSEMKIDITSMTDANIFGIGNDSAGKKVGMLALAVASATADGTSNNNLLSSSDKSSWTAKTISQATPIPLEKNSYFALAASSGDTAPTTVTNATFEISSLLVLKKADHYPGGEKVDIDGNVTFSLVYL
ncbi:DUF2574 family protein [Pantoea sp. BAV 3049]|uniref:DUF2574 family protein n=1 Tax=Pantoea sp. BAV 3049 TaxID=2654188 RepID=UPI00131D190E|nr:DUF2574 family protein [Pantoea sp. BAV 3049]